LKDKKVDVFWDTGYIPFTRLLTVLLPRPKQQSQGRHVLGLRFTRSRPSSRVQVPGLAICYCL